MGNDCPTCSATFLGVDAMGVLLKCAMYEGHCIAKVYLANHVHTTSSKAAKSAKSYSLRIDIDLLGG